MLLLTPKDKIFHAEKNMMFIKKYIRTTSKDLKFLGKLIKKQKWPPL